jgi:DNA mismatch repair protein MutS
VKGGSEHSFGIHVAKLAGLPHSVVSRANEILAQLEKDNRKSSTSENNKTNEPKKSQLPKEGYQLSFFQMDDPVLSQVRDEIVNLDVNNLTPIEALNKLNEIKKIVTGRSE